MTVSFDKRQFLIGAVSALIVPTGFAVASESTTHTIEIYNLKFAPNVVSVKPGDSVRWINRDIAPHTATALNRSWDTGKLGLGEEVILAIDEDTATDYFCAFHPHMWGQLRLA